MSEIKITRCQTKVYEILS